VLWPLVLAATFIQCVNCALSMEAPSTVATESPGTPPHPAATAAGTAKAHSARRIRTRFITGGEGSGDSFNGS
jgi:hypothetical protein